MSSKLEIRNSKQIQMLEIKSSNGIRFGFCNLNLLLRLFRISIFEFRIYPVGKVIIYG